MTPTTLRAALATIGWSNCELARRTGIQEKQIRRMLKGDAAVPERIAGWLEDLAGYHAARPAPHDPRKHDPFTWRCDQCFAEVAGLHAPCPTHGAPGPGGWCPF